MSRIVNEQSADDLRGKNTRYVPDLRGHIFQCEWNYHSLIRLLPKLETEDVRSFMVEKAELLMRVDIHVSERCKYTTMLSVRQNLGLSEKSEGASWLDGPNMTVRLYHDANMAEVISFQKQGRIPPRNEYPNRRMHHRDEKAQLNRFLGEWIEHCLHHGRVVADTPLP